MACKFKSHFAVLVLTAASSLPAPAMAQSGTWVTNSAGTYNWSQAGNWLNGVIADGADNTADFNTAGLTGLMTVSLDSPRTIGSLVFDNPTNLFGWTVSGSNTLTLGASTAGSSIIAVNNPQITATLAIPIAGTQGFTTTGPGTLVLSGTNSYSGGTSVLNGTVQVAADAGLGTGNVTGASLGTVNFTGTTTTAKSFAMNGGTVSVAAGQTVTFNGSVVSSAFLDGAGAFATSANLGAQFNNVTTTPSVSVASNSIADQFAHFSNGGSLTVAAGLGSYEDTVPIGVSLNGFTNLGTGAITINDRNYGHLAQTGTFVNVANFQSYGTLIINPADPGSGQSTLLTNIGSAPLEFSAGSRTFVGLTLVGPSPMFIAGIDLKGKNAIVAGGLFVNNGFVVDSSNGGAGTSTIIADYGSLVKGAGYFQNSVITQNGGQFKAGDSPGASSFGNFVFGPGGVNNYVFNINDATGTPGATPTGNGTSSGWGLVKAVQQSVLGTSTSPGDFVWTAVPANKLTVALDTIVNSPDVDSDALAPMANFDPTKPYSWLAVQWTGTYTGPTDAAMLDASTNFDSTGFLNPIAGTFGWSLDLQDQTLSLTYAPSAVPEPGTLALVSLAAVSMVGRRRSRIREK